jgi:hypothetical protein
MNKFRHGSVLTTLFLALVLVAPLAVPVLAGGNNNPNKLHGAPTYLLNMLGKKSDWNGDPAYDSDRRTMFVPENVTEFLELNPAFSDPDGDGEDGVNIWVDKGAEFAVTDPNAFDDGHCNLTVGPGYYRVYCVALGKPGAEAKLKGWIYNETASEYLLFVGDVKVKKGGQPVWMNGTDMFFVSEAEATAMLAGLGLGWSNVTDDISFVTDEGVWIFDFLAWLAEHDGTLSEYLYLWKLVSGCKHIQVRFYEM